MRYVEERAPLVIDPKVSGAGARNVVSCRLLVPIPYLGMY